MLITALLIIGLIIAVLKTKEAAVGATGIVIIITLNLAMGISGTQIPLEVIPIAVNINGGQKEAAYTITSIQDSSLLSGSIFLISGSINEKMVYSMYLQTKDENGDKYNVWVRVPAKYCRVYEDNKNPCIVEISNHFGDWIYSWGTCYKTSRYDIHVPPNSIVRINEFNGN